MSLYQKADQICYFLDKERERERGREREREREREIKKSKILGK